MRRGGHVPRRRQVARWLCLPSRVLLLSPRRAAPRETARFGAYGEVVQPLTDGPGNAGAGLAVFALKALGNRGSCRKVSALDDVPSQGEIGPVLDGVGSYRDAAALRGIVVNARMIFDGTVIPAFCKISEFVRPGDDYSGPPRAHADAADPARAADRGPGRLSCQPHR